MSVLKVKRGSTAAVNAYTPALGELVLDITLMQLRLGDGSTPGGINSANASTALKLATARNIALTGAVSGSVAFDGSANVSITTTLASSIALTGVPTTPTATVDTNTTQVASTAFVLGQAGAATPLVNGTAAVGTSTRYARQDHIHPIDTSRAPTASPNFTGTPLAPTAAVGTNTTQIATTAMVQAEIANKKAWTSYTPSVVAGSGTFTTASATGSWMEAFGLRYVRVTVTITTKGTGTLPTFTLPAAALAGTNGMPCFTAFKATTGKAGTGRVSSGLTTVNILGADGLDLLVADGDVITLYGSYPVA